MRRPSRRARRLAHRGRKAAAVALRALRRRLPRAAGAPAQVHLGWPGDPARGLAVVWHGSRRDPAPFAEVRPQGGDAWLRVAAACRSATAGGFVHVARFDGLAPDTVHALRVSNGDQRAPAWSGTWHPRTAPTPDGGALRAVVFGDVGIAGRHDGQSDHATRVVAEMADEAPHLVLGVGDYAYANTDYRYADPATAIDAWFEQMQPLFGCGPFLPTWGNHEVHLGERYEDWAPRCILPDGPEAGRSYAFDAGAAHFSSLFAPGEVPTRAHLDWLDADLAAARRAGARWLVVYQHAPVFSHGSAHPAHAGVRTALAPILERHGVALHVSGHDQNYERTHPLGETATCITEGGVVYAKVSPAGKRSSRGNRFSKLPDAKDPRIAARDDTCHHYGVLRVSAERFEVEIVGFSEDGGTRRSIDRFELGRG